MKSNKNMFRGIFWLLVAIVNLQLYQIECYELFEMMGLFFAFIGCVTFYIGVRSSAEQK